jgi:Sec-independent protein translocase protein TatA
MEILGIGMPELVFIVIIALLILGPKDMQKAGRIIGRFLRNLVTSDGWKLFQQTSRDLRNLPNRLMREANDELNKVGDEIKKAASPPDANRISPPNGRPQPQPHTAMPSPGAGTKPESDSRTNA